MQAAAEQPAEVVSLQASDSAPQDAMRRLGSSSDDRCRLSSALSCLKSAAAEPGGQQLLAMTENARFAHFLAGNDV